jgi:hypothetical protein
MITVWVLLAAAMIVVATVCWLTIPLSGSAGTVTPPPATTSLNGVINPKGMAPSRPWRFLIIHQASSVPVAGKMPAKEPTAPETDTAAACHFIIGNGRISGLADGQIVATQRWFDQLDGAHTKLAGHPEFNTDGIGICVLGDFDRQKPTLLQMTSLELLAIALGNRYNIPMEHVLEHGEIERTHCPGLLFPMDSLLRDLRQSHLANLVKTTSADGP